MQIEKIEKNDYLYGKESEEAMQLTAYQLEFEDLGGERVTIKID